MVMMIYGKNNFMKQKNYLLAIIVLLCVSCKGKQIDFSENERLKKDFFDSVEKGDIILTEKYEVFYPWDDVVACKERIIEEGDSILLPSLFIKSNRCYKCLRKTFWVNFRSPSWTWQKLCGRAGFLEICPHCVAQIHFELVGMN